MPTQAKITDAQQRQEGLNQAAKRDETRAGGYVRYRNYLAGEQGTRLTDRALRYLEVSGLKFAENFTETVRDVEADGLRIESWTSKADGVAEWVNELWEVPQVANTQGAVHSDAVSVGDAVVVVEWDTVRARPRLTFNEPEMWKFVYDDVGEVEYAVKVWNGYVDIGVASGQARRMNIYFPDRIEKWVTFSADDGGEGALWYPILDDGDEAWPVANVRPDGSPRGILAFHFKIGAQGRAYGRSRIHGFLPFQDELNKQLVDLFWVMDTQSYGHRWLKAKGEVSIVLAPGQVTKAEDTDAEFGQWTPDDPGPLIAAIEATLRRGAAKTRTPLHELLVTGALPSGESLKTANAGKAAKLADDHDDLTPTWADVAAMCVVLANDFGGEDLDETAVILPQWRSPHVRNEHVEAQTADIWHGIGVSAHTLMAQAGFDPDEEAARRAEEADAALDRQMDPEGEHTGGESALPGATLQGDGQAGA